jgi:hypothetical protein
MLRVALLLLFSALILSAGPSGTIAGYVKDPSDGLVAGAEVTVVDPDTGARRVAISGSRGEFEFPLLTPGVWTISVKASRFQTLEVSRVIVSIDQITRIDVVLRLGDLHEVATVSSPASLVDPERFTLSTVIDSTRISRLPLNGRQFLDIAALVPGVIPAPPGTQGLGFNAAGARSQSNVYLLDGVSNQDTQNNGPLNAFRITDAVQEFDVQTGVADAGFGRGMGAQVNIITRSGSNQFHGAAFEYLRNTRMDAADFFTNKLNGAENPLNRNQFGATLNGPALRDRLFFSLSYEGFRQVAHVVSATRVPSLAERASVTDPIASRLLPFWPIPNVDGASNYISNVRNQDSDNTGLARVDYNLGPRDQLSARWIEYRGYTVVAGPTPLTGGNQGPPAQRSGMLSETRVISPGLIHDIRLGYSSNRQERGVQDGSVNSAAILTGADGLPLPGVPANAGLPSITIAGGYAALGSNQNFPQGRFTDTVEIADNMTWQAPLRWTRHTWRWGLHVRRESLRQYMDRASRGVLNFASFANFARGLINSSSLRTGSTLAHWRRYPWDLYWEDRVKLRANLTLYYGVRYEYQSAASESGGRATNFVPGIGPMLVGTDQVLDVNPSLVGPGSLTFRRGPFALPASGVFTDKNNFAPDLGVAWSPAGSTVLRSGFRIGYDDPFNNLLTSMALAPPFNLQTSQSANVTQPGAFGWALAFNQNVPLIANFGRQGPGTPTAGVITFQGVDPRGRTPYDYHYTFGIQQAVGGFLSIEADYQGSSAHKLGIYLDVNQPSVIVRDPTKRGPLAPNEQVFPLIQWNQVQVAKTVGNSNYNGLVLTARSTMHRRWFLQASYTLGKSLDYNSSYFGSGNQPGEPGAPPDSTNLRLERGPSSFDVRQRFLTLFGFETPTGRGAWRHVTGGWRFDGVVTVQSGMPFTVVSGNPDSNGFNQSTAGISPDGGNRPNLAKSGPLAQNNGNSDSAFDTSWFAPALAGRVGTSGRNQYYGPGLQNLDVAAAKVFRVSEAGQLQLRADFFNLFNHTNFANPVSDMSNANFGRITQTLGSAVSPATGTTGGATGGPRIVQVSMRFQF